LTDDLTGHDAELRELSVGSRDLRGQVSETKAVTAAQVQDLIHLFSRFQVPARVPPMGGWAASAGLIGALLD
jgi:hypothetical protein